VGLTRVNPQERWKRDTFLKVLMEQKVLQDERDENIRVLYVALTRAKDRLILVGTGDFYKDGELKSSVSKSTYIDYLISIKDECSLNIVPFNSERLFVEQNRQADGRNKIRELMINGPASVDKEVYEEIDRRFRYKYANEAAVSKKSKYSVTEFNKQNYTFKEQIEELRAPLFMQSESASAAAIRGTVMHKVMEIIDFKAAVKAVESGDGAAYINEQAAYMVKKEFISQDELKYVEADRIAAFFNTDIGKRAAASDELYKEAEFNFLKELDGVQVMVQGVIDCFFKENGKYVLIDYKNSYIDPEHRDEGISRIRETYREQVELYKEAVSVIKDAEVAEAYLYLFSEGEFMEIQ